LFRLSGTALLLGVMGFGAFAQEDVIVRGQSSGSNSSSDIIVVTPKKGKDTKVTIEVKDGEVKVNGKPLSEFKDDDVKVSKRKSLEAITITGVPSRFRAGSAWNYNDDLLGTAEERSFLGVTTDKTSDGVKVTDVTEKSAADKAGIIKGDVITKVNSDKIETPEDLHKAIGKYKPEEKVNVTLRREGKEQSKAIVLGKRKVSTMTYTTPDNFNFNFDRLEGMNGLSGFGTRSRGKLGIKAQETEDGKGVKVIAVDEESPAAKAGIKENDIITVFDDADVNNVDVLREQAAKAAGKPSFKIKLLRDGKTEEVQVKLPKNLKTTNL
ncbi:MAG: PDZ domain-containing protein, partial [Bacteroidetes bacterium]|nr:PDZ domain-containing protein [Bacteroidota bacterium]